MELKYKMNEYDDCMRCALKYCIPQCFDNHVGSRIALGKLVNEMDDKYNTKVHIIEDR